MMLLSLFRKRLLDRKIYFRIHARYPKLFPGSRVLSLLPPTVEAKIQPGTVIEENVSLPADVQSLGRHLYIGKNTIVSRCESIGSFTSISAGVRIGLMSHPQDYVSTSPAFYAARRGFVTANTYREDEGQTTVIGHDVLISANAMIRNGVTIGHGAIIAAGAFVADDVPPYAIVAGLPARILRYRFDEALIRDLLASAWWEHDDATLRAAGNFEQPRTFLAALPKR